VPAFVSVTVAPGSTAPLESVTVPTMAALFCCALTFPASESNKIVKIDATITMVFMRNLVLIVSPLP
jgi:hypothetical protein